MREEVARTNLKVVLQRRSRQQQSELDVQSHQRLVSRRLVVLELMSFVEHGRLRKRKANHKNERSDHHRRVSILSDEVK